MFEELREAIHEKFSQYSARELAIYFTKGFLDSEPDMTTEKVENNRMFIRYHLSTTFPEFQREFQEHLEDLSRRTG